LLLKGISIFPKHNTPNKMKPTSTSTIEPRLARHDRRARGHRALPITDYFFRPDTDVTAGHAQRRTGFSSRRAFRRMIAIMMTKKDGPDRLEMLIYGLVTAISAWPLVQLLVVLAQTAKG
jgi:hypothetical protein